MMGMGAFGWFWVMVSVYSDFFAKSGFKCT